MIMRCRRLFACAGPEDGLYVDDLAGLNVQMNKIKMIWLAWMFKGVRSV